MKPRYTKRAKDVAASIFGNGNICDEVAEVETLRDQFKATQASKDKRITQLVARVKELEAERDRLRAQLERRP